MSSFITLKNILKPRQETILRYNGILGKFHEKVWIIGTGRSGTTWLQELMASRQPFYTIFEPFHPKTHHVFSPSVPYIYLNEGEFHPDIEKLSKTVFSGRFYDPSRYKFKQYLFYQGILVKDIFANLMAKQIYQNHPGLKIILLLRNPFAVAVSKFNKKEWDWMKDPALFLQDKDLVNDFLTDYSGLIRNISNLNDYILNQILIWSIVHYVPFKQFGNGQIHLVYYEDLLKNTCKELSNIFTFIKEKPQKISVDEETIFRPTAVTSQTSHQLKNRPLDSWKSQLTSDQIKTGMEILEAFGLHKLYREDGLPVADTLY